MTGDAGGKGGFPLSQNLGIRFTVSCQATENPGCNPYNGGPTVDPIGSFSVSVGCTFTCDGGGYGETSVASAVLSIGATITANDLAVPGVDNGSFDVTISYQ